MSSFTEPLIVEILQKEREGRVLARIIEGFTYYTDIFGEDTRTTLRVPGDFETDFASVPRLFWALVPPLGPYAKASVVHDYLYSVRVYPKKECDRIFLEAMEVLGVGKISRTIMYLAVRYFGPQF